MQPLIGFCLCINTTVNCTHMGRLCYFYNEDSFLNMIMHYDIGYISTNSCPGIPKNLSTRCSNTGGTNLEIKKEFGNLEKYLKDSLKLYSDWYVPALIAELSRFCNLLLALSRYIVGLNTGWDL